MIKIDGMEFDDSPPKSHSYYVWEDKHYTHVGLIHVWNVMCDPDKWGYDPPRFHDKFKTWCKEHKIPYKRIEKTGNVEFIFDTFEAYMHFRIAWL